MKNKTLWGVLVLIGIISFVYFFAKPVGAKDPKPDAVCGTEKDTCTLGKFTDKEDDETYYKWECGGKGYEKVSCELAIPQPTVSIDKPALVCDTNHITFQGDYVLGDTDNEHYVKFIINGREPEVTLGEGTWNTGELTLAPKAYVTRAELWKVGRCISDLRMPCIPSETPVASEDYNFTIVECEVPETSSTPAPEAPKPSAPVCNAVTPNKVPANFHIYRSGDQAKVVWFYDPSIEWKVVVYYGLSGQGDQHSVILNNNQSGYIINGLGNRDFDFRAIFLNDCAGGGSTKAIIDAVTRKWTLFR